MAMRPQRFRPPGSVQGSKAYEDRRGTAASRGYDAQWKRERDAFLRDNPLCQYGEVGAFGDVHVAASALPDHLYPHKGDRELFWRRDLWVACCTMCHSGPKQAVERQGRAALDVLARHLGRVR